METLSENNLFVPLNVLMILKLLKRRVSLKYVRIKKKNNVLTRKICEYMYFTVKFLNIYIYKCETKINEFRLEPCLFFFIENLVLNTCLHNIRFIRILIVTRFVPNRIFVQILDTKLIDQSTR